MLIQALPQVRSSSSSGDNKKSSIPSFYFIPPQAEMLRNPFASLVLILGSPPAIFFITQRTDSHIFVIALNSRHHVHNLPRALFKPRRNISPSQPPSPSPLRFILSCALSSSDSCFHEYASLLSPSLFLPLTHQAQTHFSFTNTGLQ